MSRLSVFAVLTWLSTYGACLMNFINPPPFGQEKDYTDNPVYTIGKTVIVGWTAGKEGTGASLVLYQLNKTDGMWFGDAEYLTQNSLNAQTYNWLVGTRKNLSESDLFYFSIFEEGQTSSDSNSHYFYIRKEAETSTSSSATPSATTSSVSSTSSSSPTGIPSSPPPATSAASKSGSSSGLGAGAIAGIVVAIVAALAIGFGLAFLLFRRRSKKTLETPPMSANPYADHPPAELHNWSAPVEADTAAKYAHQTGPVEIGDNAPIRHG